MLRLMKQEFAVSEGKLTELSFRDEFAILAKLKKLHHTTINRRAAVKIQSVAKMYMIRKRFSALIELRRYSARLLTGHYRRQIALMRFQRAWRLIKDTAATKV